MNKALITGLLLFSLVVIVGSVLYQQHDIRSEGWRREGGDASLMKGSVFPGKKVKSYTVIANGGGRVDWSKANNRIYFDKKNAEGYYDIYWMNPDGSNETCISCSFRTENDYHIGNPAVDPTGSYILYQEEDRNLNPIGTNLPSTAGQYATSPGVGLNNNIWIMTIDGQQRWQVTEVGNYEGVLHPKFNQDGTGILWSHMTGNNMNTGMRRTGEWEMRTASLHRATDRQTGPVNLNTIQVLKPDNHQLYETHGYINNDSILFSYVPRDGYYENMEIGVYDPQTQQVTQLTENLEWDEHAHLSPAGNTMVWVSSDGTSSLPTSLNLTNLSRVELEMWRMNADGTGKERLTYFNQRRTPEFMRQKIVVGDNSWSPEGDRVAAYVFTGKKHSNDPYAEAVVILDF
ncbi:MAG: hypothetical protein H6774_00625 [Pseudomonadales bacterium]|nr:hypothetical protein [Candidatus Woesebacteria bacterium]MCB9801572.1 hypothetical protein [Pseudomonadales bacterium]